MRIRNTNTQRFLGRKLVVSLALAGGVVGLTGACTTRDISKVDLNTSKESPQDVTAGSNRDIDILFVIDDSSSMKDKQDVLAANFPKFIDTLSSIKGGLPNIHLGVVSSTVDIPGVGGCSGGNGLLQNTPHPSGSGTCVGPNGGARYIEDILLPDGTRMKNYSGNLQDVFSCIARLGTGGCGFEHHFEGMKEALDGSNPENAGFLRQNAYLAIVILGDEDDCSASDQSVFNQTQAQNTLTSQYGPDESYRCTEFGITCDGLPSLPRSAAEYTTCVPRGDSYLYHPQHYVDFIKSLKPSTSQILVAVIGGNPTPVGVAIGNRPITVIDGAPYLEHSCQAVINGTMNVGDPGVRFKYFADQFAPLSTYQSICQADFTDALTVIAQKLATILGDPCFSGSIDDSDIDPNSPGLQLDCSLSDVQNEGTAQQASTPIARCPMTDDTTPDLSSASFPCWWAEVDVANCPTAKSPQNISIHVERNGESPQVGTQLVTDCVGQ